MIENELDEIKELLKSIDESLKVLVGISQTKSKVNKNGK